MSSDPLPEIPSLGLSEDGRWEMMGMAYSVSVLPQAEEQSDAWACTRSTDPNEQNTWNLYRGWLEGMGVFEPHVENAGDISTACR